MGNRRPKVKVVPSGGRTPRAVEASVIPAGKKPYREFTPEDPEGKVIVLFSRVDVGGPWCLTKIKPTDHAALLERIAGFESMTVNEVFHNGEEPGKDYTLAELPNPQALKRLRQLTFDDRDDISRLRVNGPGRLYGFRERERFYVLWWDPKHEVWPSKK